ncbi:hypothetical protein CO165_03635 [Candidatus Roizmanbacteria bacterium CG_4_9_14_3_um_filter_33_18]|uniref:Uncharacterized protein n=1 Tax=Candidatus Roizmanbacteria bacterium CG_4_9_14_3_um_filter_33_18 TaxID=1974841 RepID=A0A2M7XXH0_9BACT|nr:MAG: hypothetical protein CO165_03635 [Candidatus Roizmanbacteria bacterium CG_4_9_14_3_um_filter_33_18]
MKKIFENEFLVFILLIILFIAIRSLHFVPALNFSFDQGNGFTRILEMWKNKEITLVGPGSSISADNKLLLQGSILYYFTLIFAVPGKFDPIVSSYIFMIFSSFGIIPLYSGMKKLANQKTALLMVVLYTLLPMFIDYTRFFFGPNFLIPLSTILIYLMGLHKTKPNSIYLFFIFAYTGILIQFHYQIVIILFILFIYYSFIKRFRIKSILIMIGGFCVGFSPMILFELKNQFYNLHVIRDYLFSSKPHSGAPFQILPHRYLSISILTLALISSYFKKYISYFLIITVAIILIIFDAFIYLPKPSHGFGMSPNWNYLMEKKTYEIIKTQNVKNYNIVNHIYDNLSMVIKFHLKKDGVKMSYEDYYHNDYLYVISKNADVFKDPAYELNTFVPNKLVKSWKLNEIYNLYLFKRVQK